GAAGGEAPLVALRGGGAALAVAEDRQDTTEDEREHDDRGTDPDERPARHDEAECDEEAAREQDPRRGPGGDGLALVARGAGGREVVHLLLGHGAVLSLISGAARVSDTSARVVTLAE